jgi:hypothetical protein
MSNALLKITTRARQIQRAHPKKKWIECVKAAGREYRSGKKAAKPAPRKKATPRKAARKTAARPAAKRTTRPASSHKAAGTATRSESSLKAELLHRLTDALGKEEVRKFMAKTKREKNQIAKKISEVKAKIRRLR